MAMPGLKTFLQGIDMPVLRAFFNVEEPFAGKSIDWELPGRELAEKIYVLMAELRHDNDCASISGSACSSVVLASGARFRARTGAGCLSVC